MKNDQQSVKQRFKEEAQAILCVKIWHKGT